MNNRTRTAVVVLAIVWVVLGATRCAPYLSPTIVPPTQSPEFEPFRTTLKTYLDQTQASRKAAADLGDAVSDQTLASGSDEAVRLRGSAPCAVVHTLASC